MSGQGGLFQQRRAGILLHITSLPGAAPCGNLGPDAYRFVDFLASSGQTVWQLLPIGPTHEDGSPYQCLSLYAGNPLLISPEQLVQDGLASTEDARLALHGEGSQLQRWQSLIRQVQINFRKSANQEQREAYAEFVHEQQGWLDDYALYRAIRETHGNKSWIDWPKGVRDRELTAMEEIRLLLADAIETCRFEQFIFYRQWCALKNYANSLNVLLFGDMPIFVAFDSADVWAQRHYFQLDALGNPLVVAGVPPDYFSEDGQRWGNPHYRWDRMADDGFQWWISRIRNQLSLFDLVRIDHFRGFEAYWEIPAEHDTAKHGCWVKAPGDALFNTLKRYFDPLPVVAEDLGLITQEVNEMRLRHGFPGMKVLQFAFYGGIDNPYLPHNHERTAVVYTGTHDNSTSLGWFAGLSGELRAYVNDYLNVRDEAMPWPLIRAAMSSVAWLSVIPMQDVLQLGDEARMNMPGTTQGNWKWRYSWDQLDSGAAARLRHLSGLYGRVPQQL